jgi:NADH:quinone reductase (non-electrogenic)
VHTPTVVVVGGGFAGLYAARGLARHPVRVTLIDRVNYHLFQPLLYQVATAALSPGEIAEPLRAILRKYRNVEVLLGEVSRIDVQARTVSLDDGDTFTYDYLVLATGARHSYFAHPEWEPTAPGLKSLADALEIRRRIFLAFELAEREEDPALRQSLLTFVIVGGGPTGVELAGAIAEIARHTVSKDFRRFDPRQARVVLLERADRILEQYPKDLSASAQRALEHIGVEVRTGTGATDIQPDRVVIGDEVIPTYTTLWAAGVASSPLGRQLGLEVDRSGRVPVQPDLSLAEHPEVFVAGDLALLRQPNGKILPGVAPVAIQQGEAAADNIWRSISGQPRRAFKYVDRGSMATIGRAAAVAEIRGLHLSGFVAWLAWLFVHLLFLIGFENRVLVLVQWAASYLSYKRGARLITGPWHAGTPMPRLHQTSGISTPELTTSTPSPLDSGRSIAR